MLLAPESAMVVCEIGAALTRGGNRVVVRQPYMLLSDGREQNLVVDGGLGAK